MKAAEPKYTPTTYVAQPAAEPFFFNNMGFGRGGMGWLGSNNMGGKVLNHLMVHTDMRKKGES